MNVNGRVVARGLPSQAQPDSGAGLRSSCWLSVESQQRSEGASRFHDQLTSDAVGGQSGNPESKEWCGRAEVLANA